MPPKPQPQPKPPRRLHCFVTGQPGSGKTTLVSRVCERLRAQGVPLTGFYTEEVRAGGERTGFDVITLGSGGGRRGPLARVGKAKAGQPAVGSYVVDLASFEKLALPSLSLVGLRGEGDGDAAGAGAGDGGNRKRPRKESAAESAAGGAASGEGSSDGGGGRPRVVVIDEVGKMELFSPAFQARVAALLDDPGEVILGTVPMPRYGREIPFVGGIKARADVALVKVLKKTREEAFQEALSHILAALGLPKEST